jgi:hypothetical protein
MAFYYSQRQAQDFEGRKKGRKERRKKGKKEGRKEEINILKTLSNWIKGNFILWRTFFHNLEQLNRYKLKYIDIYFPFIRLAKEKNGKTDESCQNQHEVICVKPYQKQ